MMRGRAVAILLAALSVPLALPATRADAAHDAAERGLAWLAAHPDQYPTAGFVAVAVAEAAAVSGKDLRAWPSADAPVYRLLTHYAPSKGGGEEIESEMREAHAAGLGGYDPRDLNGRDAVAMIRAAYHDGHFTAGTNVPTDMWGILGLWAAGVPADDPQIQGAAQSVLAARDADGGWQIHPANAKSDTDLTGHALVALRAAGALEPGDLRALLFLNSTHASGGGHSPQIGLGQQPLCQSTAWALQGYRALGVAPPEDDLAFLLALQDAEGGFATSKGAPADAWCTAEAVAYLAQASADPPRYQSCGPLVGEIHALEPATLRVPVNFTAATWATAEQRATGRYAALTFAQQGDAPFALDATGPGVVCRVRGMLHVLTARPIVALASADLAALRKSPLALDLRASRDPDGTVALYRVDWGDGYVTDATGAQPAHAYERPGDFAGLARVRDDEGAWSDAIAFTVHARNQAPAFGALPTRVVADRAHDLSLDVGATDPEGDAVALAWSMGNASGTGAPRLRPWALGNFTLSLAARDAYDADAHASVLVEVVDLAPRLANLSLPERAVEGEPFAFAVEAADADGPAPNVTWTFGNLTRKGASGSVALAAGTYPVTVVARDPEGLEARASGVVVVAPRDAPAAQAPPPAPPSILALEVAFEDGVLAVRADVAPASAVATVRYASDAGNGTARLDSGRARIALPEATRVEVELVAEANGLRVAQRAGPYEAAPAAPAALGLPGVRVPLDATPGAPSTLLLTMPEGADVLQVDFGDGTTTGWSQATNATHAWMLPGVYAIRVDARADDGRVSSARANLTVRAPAAALPREPLETSSAKPAPAGPSLVPQQAQGARPVPAPGAIPAMAAAALCAALLARARRARR